MNDTRIQSELPKNATKSMVQRYKTRDMHFEIPVQGEFFWDRYKAVQNGWGQDCQQSPKFIIGWSTGGLAAYRMAHEKRARAVILIAPGIHPKMMVGESAHRWDRMLLFRQTISERTLTRNRFEDGPNPHVDPIQPKSPMHVPRFAGNLLGVSLQAAHWQIDEAVKGLVLLSGDEDTYVDRESTLQTLKKNAPHFEIKTYDGALHELDNELPEIAQDVFEESVRFLDSAGATP